MDLQGSIITNKEFIPKEQALFTFTKYLIMHLSHYTDSNVFQMMWTDMNSVR